MKTKQTLTLCLITLFFTCTMISCKKDNDDKKATCRIVTITETNSSSTTVHNISYNNDGKISTLTSTGSSTTNKVFTYSGNTLIINSTSGGSFSSRDSITIDGKGKPTNIRQFHNQSGTSWTNFSFEYNGDDLLKFHQTSSTSSTPITNVATYVNGNMTALTSTSSSATLEYFTNQKVQAGDYLEMLSLIQYGVTVYPHKNLVKTISTGGNITNFNYETNADGQITKVTSTSGSSVGSLTYQYQCN